MAHPKERIAALWGAALLLSGCAAVGPSELVLRQPACLSGCGPCIEEELKAAAQRLCTTSGVAQMLPVLIPDFVHLDNFRPGTLGKRLAEEFRLAWQKSCANPVRVVELGAHFRLDQDGLKILTRELEALASSEVADPIALIGTYRLEAEAVRFFVRRVNLKHQEATNMAAGNVPRICLEPTIKLPRTLLE